MGRTRKLNYLNSGSGEKLWYLGDKLIISKYPEMISIILPEGEILKLKVRWTKEDGYAHLMKVSKLLDYGVVVYA
jgi:hypothetical protein